MTGGIFVNKKKKITLLLAITSLSIFIMHIINKTIFLLSTIKEILYSDNSNYYNWRFGKIFYTKRGTGLPALLIHDLDNISCDLEWKETINRLSEKHTVYTIDLLGCGRSDKPEMTYTTFLYVQLLTDFVKNVIKQPTDVVVTGHACSSIIMACYSDSKLFHNLILVNPDNLISMNQIPRYKHKILQFILNIPIFGTFIYNISASLPIIKDTFSKKYFADSTKISSKYIRGYHEAAHFGGSTSKYLYSSIICHYTNTNIVHALKEINNNITIIGGDLEKDIYTTIEQYVQCNPSIETSRIKQTKHLPQLERPSEFNALLSLYLTE